MKRGLVCYQSSVSPADGHLSTASHVVPTMLLPYMGMNISLPFGQTIFVTEKV